MTNGDAEKQIGAKRRSILDFFLRSRRRRRSGAKKADSDDPATILLQAERHSDDHKERIVNRAVAGGSTGDETAADSSQEYFSEQDLRQMFLGAPQFSAQLSNGRVQASASFPWNFDLHTRDLNDARPIPHAAFSGCTLHQHLPRLEARKDKTPITYDVGALELPSMLDSTGNEPGSVGIGFFVQEPDADILNAHGAANETPNEVFDNFSNFELLESQPEKLGIRKLDFSVVIERLVELSSTYETANEKDRAFSLLNRAASGELYSSLFGKVLTPPKFDNTAEDPTGLKVQIEALIRILNLKRVWYDFSNVEWRIRIGQLIYSDASADMADSNLSEPEDGLTERDVTLLQLLLACELYIRLEAVASLDIEEVENDVKLTGNEVKHFHDMESRKTKWDLVLARRFLENIKATTFMRPKIVTQSENSLARTLLGMSQRESVVKVDEMDIVFEPRRQDLQLQGLYHFAETLDWPDQERLHQHFRAALSQADVPGELASPSIYATPLSTPGTMTPRSFRSDRESGYFAGAAGSSSPEMTPRSFQLSPPSRLDLNASMNDQSDPIIQRASIGGWLTRSYLTGLILPGEALCHLLISALLENDAESIAALGENANLYGGFVYKGRSFWSKSCILGRVLACLSTSKECMGWISSDVIPEGYSDGWLDVSSAPVQLKRIDVVDRAFENNTHFLAGKEPSSTRASELNLPLEAPRKTMEDHIRLTGLQLEPNTPIAASHFAGEPPLSASLEFVIREDNNDEDRTQEMHAIPLSHLVQFISAYPCTPPASTVLKNSNSHGGEDANASSSQAHPLHEAYQYRCVTTADLLNPKFDIEHGSSAAVIVVDARGNTDHELLIRAWCSSVGLDAIIARTGITCLSCAIREARGLAIQVLIRVGEA